MKTHLKNMLARRSLPSLKTWIGVNGKTNTYITLILAALISVPALAMEQMPCNFCTEDNKTELHIEAGTRNHAPMVLEILEFEGTRDVHAQDIYGNVPLHEAAYFGCPGSVRHLIEYGADVNARNKNGDTPLDKATYTNQEAIIALLKQHGGRSGKEIRPKQAPQKTQPKAHPAADAKAYRAPKVMPTPKQTPPRPQQSGNVRPGIAPCIFPQDQLLNLPELTGSLNLPGIYHVYSEAPVATQKDWACAFHALDNMRILEQEICGRAISEQTFINACKHNCRTLRKGSDCAEQYRIAKQMGLPHMINLEINDNGTGTEIVFDNNQPDDIGSVKHQNKEWTRLTHLFKQSGGPICIHFCAGIMSYTTDSPNQGEGHGIDISVIKDRNGAVAMYIFDNVNDGEAKRSQKSIRKHVEFIYRKLIG